MKKYILLLIIPLVLHSCIEEDETLDPTIMPEITTHGADTFGCLIDNWLYVGGRFYYSFSSTFWGIPAEDCFSFKLNKETGNMEVNVMVRRDAFIQFTILHPQEGEETTYTNAKFGNKSLANGTVKILRYDQQERIISGVFEGGKVTFGRFDMNYIEEE